MTQPDHATGPPDGPDNPANPSNPVTGPDAHKPPAAPAGSAQLALDFGPPPRAGFRNFIAGPNTDCVRTLHALAHWCSVPATPAPPELPRFVYIWGSPGTGKSHLCEALASSGADARRLTLQDDCQLLDLDEQVAMYHHYNEIRQRPDRALVAFGSMPPGRLPILADLSSRLSWGVVFRLQPLHEPDVRRALQRFIEDRGLLLNHSVTDYLMVHGPRNVAGLKAVLEQLEHMSGQTQRALTLPLLRRLLAAQPHQEPF